MKTKPIILMFVGSLLVLQAVAQRPGKGDKLLTFGLFNDAGFLAYKIYKDSSNVTRFGITGGGGYSTNSQDQPSFRFNPTYKSSSTASRFDVGLFWGKQKSFFTFKRFEPYIGFDANVTMSYSYSNTKRTVVDTSNYVSNPYPSIYREYLGDGTSSTTINPVTLGASFIPFIGFNYFIFKNFALGAEYRLTLGQLTYSFAGKNTTIETYQGVTRESQGNIDPSFRGSFSLRGQGFITASYYFN